MKRKDFITLRARKIEELAKIVSEKKRDLELLLLKASSGGEKNLKKGKNLKKEIAQILTLIKEKEIGG